MNRVVLAPVELGPYNRHSGHHYGGEGQGTFILGNRHIVKLRQGDLALIEGRDPIRGLRLEDFIVHELTQRDSGSCCRNTPAIRSGT